MSNYIRVLKVCDFNSFVHDKTVELISKDFRSFTWSILYFKPFKFEVRNSSYSLHPLSLRLTLFFVRC